MDNIMLTTRKPIKAPSHEAVQKIAERGEVGDKSRKFVIQFANVKEWEICEWMRKFDLWHDRNIFSEGVITTRSTLALKDYKKIMAYSIEQTGGKLFSIVEIIES